MVAKWSFGFLVLLTMTCYNCLTVRAQIPDFANEAMKRHEQIRRESQQRMDQMQRSMDQLMDSHRNAAGPAFPSTSRAGSHSPGGRPSTGRQPRLCPECSGPLTGAGGTCLFCADRTRTTAPVPTPHYNSDRWDDDSSSSGSGRVRLRGLGKLIGLVVLGVVAVGGWIIKMLTGKK